ncbi:Gfo/Idh/MocA family protein [Cellulosimicrobium cellulans]|uniref:Gfo/Idh/MocA family protein n=1 Tax=Cellulosimicrobium cellulans TaxID=1710 RepID=UPI000848DFFF|nr:Gfo/Idh/MocA family oxidoreductase [Cellulosimicrobium cellulans]
MTTRIALVGAGSVARRHAAVLTGLPGVRVVAVADPVRDAAEALAAQCDAAAFTDVEQALDHGPVDAAYVCVPPFAHGLPEQAVLARRLPMFVEKPVAADLATAERLAALVEEAGVVTGTGYHWRCLDVVPQAQELLAQSPPSLASGYWLDKRPPVAWWSDTARSGGQVVEQLTHVLDLARVLLGEAVEVFAAGVRQALPPGAEPDGDVDDATAATVRFASGAVATLAATSLLHAKHRAALHTFSPGLVLELSETGMVVDDGTARDDRRPAEDPKVTVDREFVEAVRGERDGTRAPYAEAVRSHRLGCAVAESARNGRPVTLGSPVAPR